MQLDITKPAEDIDGYQVCVYDASGTEVAGLGNLMYTADGKSVQYDEDGKIIKSREAENNVSILAGGQYTYTDNETGEEKTVGLEEENMVPNLSESVSVDADGVMHITMTNLDLEHAYPIETTILGKKVESIEAQIVTQEMHAKNTFDDPENVVVQSFEGVEKVHAGIKFTIPACSVLHIALK